MNLIDDEQKQLLKLTTLQNGRNAWDFVQSFTDADKEWENLIELGMTLDLTGGA